MSKELEKLEKYLDDTKKLEDEFFEEFGFTTDYARHAMLVEWARAHNKSKGIKHT